jgi:hypothetical protein
VKSDAGKIGDSHEIRFQFQEFARLQIGSTWYLISDRKLWRFHAKYRKVSEKILQSDLNRDGDKLDEIWIGDGAVSDATNTGF